MAGDPLGQMTWHLSGGAANNDSDLSLGGARSNFECRHNGTTVAANGAAGDIRVYLASVSANWATSAIYFRDGVSGGFASRVTAISVGSGWVDLLQPLPSSIAIGDTVWAYNQAYGPMPFKNTTALESALGFTQYLGLYTTKPGAALTDFRYWLDVANPGPVEHEIAASNDNAHTLTTKPNLETPPDLSGMLVGGAAGRWTPARHFNAGWPIFNYSSGVVGFWLKRVSPANALRLSGEIVSVVGETPGGFSSRLVLYWDTAGFVPLLQVNHAPTVYLRGGARFKATVIGQETGLRVPNVPVGFAKTAGPGTLTLPPDPSETDENGEILARYAAPTDVGEIGNTFTIEASV